MTEKELIDQIKKRLESNEYFVHPLSDANVRTDITSLLKLIDEKNEMLRKWEKKNEVLSTQVLELSQEIENVKSDFGNSSR